MSPQPFLARQSQKSHRMDREKAGDLPSRRSSETVVPTQRSVMSMVSRTNEAYNAVSPRSVPS